VLAYLHCAYPFGCYPCLKAEPMMAIREVHVSDLIRAHEGNAESNPDYPNKIHWGKFNMIGKFVQSTTLCQVQCRSTQDYNFKPNHHIERLTQQNVMTIEVRPILTLRGVADTFHRCKSRELPLRLVNFSKNQIRFTYLLGLILARSRAPVNTGMLRIVYENSSHGNRQVSANTLYRNTSVVSRSICLHLPIPTSTHSFRCLLDCILSVTFRADRSNLACVISLFFFTPSRCRRKPPFKTRNQFAPQISKPERINRNAPSALDLKSWNFSAVHDPIANVYHRRLNFRLLMFSSLSCRRVFKFVIWRILHMLVCMG
jgi:hypothetical protein